MEEDVSVVQISFQVFFHLLGLKLSYSKFDILYRLQYRKKKLKNFYPLKHDLRSERKDDFL